tara:strand:+ start:356 stop:589 length:234 start_codon:yes stop_codon:yes gene_type:complete
VKDKLGLYINNLMATIVDREEKHFVRQLSFNELQKLNHDIGSFLINHDGTFNNVPEELKQKDKNQIQIEFGDKNENK